MASIVLDLVLFSVTLFGALFQDQSAQGRTLMDNLADATEGQGIVKTIEDRERGVFIDCIDVYKQPALSHPLLKNHTIQMKPSSLYPVKRNEEKSKGVDFYQSWRKFGECPQRTIPVLRTTQKRLYDQIIAAKGAHMAKVKDVNGSHHNIAFASAPGVEVAQVSVTGKEYVAAHGYLNTWTPSVAPEETSSGQIWLVSNGEPETLLDVISAGWMPLSVIGVQADPSSHFPKETIFFIFWMGNPKLQAGCFNLECPGFVQVTTKHFVGGPFRPVSTYGGDQFEFEITITKDNDTGNWWLRMQGDDMGYWPPSLFSGSLRNHANIITWGGQVVSNGAQPGNRHTKTQMGSGHFPDEGYKKASFIRTLTYTTLDNSDNPVDKKKKPRFSKYATRYKCYDVDIGKDDLWGDYIFFGGPGYWERCKDY